MRDGILLQDNDFELLDFDCFGNVISVKYKGVYVIVDNGYLQMVMYCSPIYHHVKRCGVYIWNIKGEVTNLEVGR